MADLVKGQIDKKKSSIIEFDELLFLISQLMVLMLND